MPSDAPFILALNAAVAGTHWVDDIDLSPRFLREWFGEPRPCDHYKVSGEYRFVTRKGEVFTLHDWKVTTLYHGPDSDVPTPEQFWASDEPVTFSVGGHGEDGDGSADVLIEWLLAEQEAWRSGTRRTVEDD